MSWTRTILSLSLGLLLAAPALADDTAPSEGVQISIERYEELLRTARSRFAASLSRGTVSVRLPSDSGRSAAVELSTELKVVGDSEVEVPLLAAEHFLSAATLNGSQLAVTTRGGMHIATLDSNQRSGTIRLQYSVSGQVADDGGFVAVIPLPPLTSAEVSVQRNGVTGAIHVWPGATSKADASTVTASVPASAAFVVRWAGGQSGGAVRKAAFDMKVDQSGDGVNVSASIQVQVRGSEARVRLAPDTVALVDVREGTREVTTSVIDGWHTARVTGTGLHTLSVAMRKLVDRSQGLPRVHLDLDRYPITSIAMTVPGKREVKFEPSIPLERVESGRAGAEQTRVSGHLPPVEGVEISWTESRAAPEKLERINADTYQIVSIQEGALRSVVTVDYDVIRGKVKELVVQIPDDVVLYKVEGPKIEDWRTFAAMEGKPRQVRVVLSEELEGRYSLGLELEKVIAKAEGSALVVPIVRPLGAFRESGVIALSDGAKIGFAPAEASKFAKVGQDALPVAIREGIRGSVNQAFKHIGEPGAISSKVAVAQQKEIKYDSRIQTLYSVKDGALIANASIQVEVKSGRSAELVLSMPAGVNVLSLTAPSLNKAAPAEDFDAGEGRKGHRVSFTQALEGAFQLELELELLLEKELGSVMVPDVHVEGSEVEEGSFGIAAETGIEVQQVAAADLRRVDVSELPKAVRLRSERDILLGYHYTHRPWSLELNVKRLKTVETLKAVANPVSIETTVLEDGHIVTRAVFNVSNDDRQYLRLKLPEGSKVWTVSQAGQGVKAVHDEQGALAIPLPKNQATDVEVIYETSRDNLGLGGNVSLVAPTADLLVTDLRWSVRMPSRYAILRIDTPLSEVPGLSIVTPPRQEGSQKLPIALPLPDEVQTLGFKLAVANPSEGAPRVELTYAVTPGGWLGDLCALLCLLGLAFVVRLRGAGLPLGRLGVLAAVIAALSGILYAVGWGLSVEFGVTTLVVLVAVACGSAWMRTREEA